MDDKTPANSRYKIAIEAPEELTRKQATLAEVYVQTGNLTEATRAAGYAETSIGARSIKKPAVKAYIDSLRASLAPVVWDASEIINRIQALAESGKAEQTKIKALELLAKTKAMLTDKVKIELPRRVIIRAPNSSTAYELGHKE